MISDKVDSQTDEWSDWLLHRRHADDLEYAQRVREAVNRIRDRVVEGARLCSGMILADIGAGDGLIAFDAIDRIGPSLRVIFTDISVPLLHHAESLAVERGVREQCTFLQCSADHLAEIPDASVDVVTTRAVLAYVSDKTAALREFYRVLKPGGRISIAEPIFRDNAYETIELKRFIEAQPPESRNRFLPLLHKWKASLFPDTPDLMAKNPLTNFSERDLFRYVAAAGFTEIRLEFHIEILPCITTSWDVFVGSSPHPWAPSLETILTSQFTVDERQDFEQAMRPVVEQNQSTSTERNAYVTAIKPHSRSKLDVIN